MLFYCLQNLFIFFFFFQLFFPYFFFLYDIRESNSLDSDQTGCFVWDQPVCNLQTMRLCKKILETCLNRDTDLIEGFWSKVQIMIKKMQTML